MSNRSWITGSSGIAQIGENTLRCVFYYGEGETWKERIDHAEVCWNYWTSFDVQGKDNPELTDGVQSIDVSVFSGYQFTAEFDLPVDAVWVRVWARLVWKQKESDSSSGSGTTEYYWLTDSKGVEDWHGWYQWVINDDSWPLKPPEPQYRFLNDGLIEVWVSDISPKSLRWANDVVFEMADRNNRRVAVKTFRYWDGRGIETDNYAPGNDPITDPPDEYFATTASATFEVEPGKQYYFRATSLRYGNGRRPPNGERWYPYVLPGESVWTEWVPDGIDGIIVVPQTVKLKSVVAKTATSVLLDWDGGETPDKDTTYTIVYAERKEYLEDESNARTEVSDISALTYFLTGLESGKQYFFTVYAVNSAGKSKNSNILSIILGRKPAAPTTWSSTTTASLGKKVILYWSHNSEDNSRQRHAQLSLIVNDGKEQILTFGVKNPDADEEDQDPISSYIINTNDYKEGAVIKWKVRTAGVLLESNGFPAYGPWSIVRTVEIFAPPSLALSGDDIVESFPYEITLEAGPKSQKVVGFFLAIYSQDSYVDIDETGSEIYIGPGQEVYSLYYDPDSDKDEDTDLLKWDHNNMRLTARLKPQNINLSNGQRYTVRANVTMNTGLSLDNDSTYEFLVRWSEAMDGSVMGNVFINNNNLTAQISAQYRKINGELDRDVYLSFFRRTYDGRYLALERDIQNNGGIGVYDPHPPLDYANYRIVATSQKTGAVTYSDVGPYKVGEIYAVIQWDEAWPEYYDLYTGPGSIDQPNWTGTMLKLPWNLDIADKWSPQSSTVEYIGREHPVGYYGTQVGATSNWKIDVVKADREMIAKLRRLATYKGDVYVREPYGSGYWAMVKVSFSQNHTNLVVPVTLDITRVEGGV